MTKTETINAQAKIIAEKMKSLPENSDKTANEIFALALQKAIAERNINANKI